MWSKKRLIVPPVIAILLWVLLPAGTGRSEPFSLEPLPVLKENPQAKGLIELGKKLFFDRRLSGDGTMNCATCHIPESAFTDGQAIALSYPTTRSFRNTPTLMNVAYEKRFFLDGRAESLEEQALGPIASPFEMNQDLDFLEEELASVPEYRQDFKNAFGTSGISRERIAQALAAFERTLVSKDVPLDRYLAGESSALSPAAKRGLALFCGKAGCLRCHNGPRLSDERFYPLLVPENKAEEQDPAVLVSLRYLAKKLGMEGYGELNVDPGRFEVTKKKEDFRAFKTPTLREVGRTAPYMHNGVFKTLGEVIDFFDRGGGKGNVVLTPLELTKQEKEDLIAFLKEGLTGEAIDLSPPRIP